MRCFNILSNKLKLALLSKALVFILLYPNYSFAFNSNLISEYKCESFKLGVKNVCLETPKNGEDTRLGLMFRKKLAEDNGMLFTWEQSGNHCMWMKNTLIPLDAAFIDESKTIKLIKPMQPGSLDSHCAPSSVKYVVEMNQGWFKRNNVKAGDKLKFL